MSPFISELLGTMVLIALGNGVVANVVLKKTLGNQSGWIVITLGWAMAVFAGVFVAAPGSGAHLNPAITLAFAYLGQTDWSLVPTYIAGQFAGAFAGSILVWLAYRQHFDLEQEAAEKRAVFCNAPAIPDMFHNLLTEIVATFLFTYAVLHIAAPSIAVGDQSGKLALGALDALPVALVVLGVGLSLGGPTGYAINPARDLGPRIMHAILPIRGKGGSNWSYSWIPVAGPILGALLAAVLYQWVG